MKPVRQRASLILAVVLIFSLLSTPALAEAGTLDAAATPAQYTFSVDGKNVSLWAYEIDGSIYFKLRDLAMALNGTEKQFEVSWDESKNAVSLTIGTVYTPVGGELSKPSELSALYKDKGIVAHSPTTSFYIDDRQVPIRAYTVNDANYIMLSDLAANIMFAFGCDEEMHLVKITAKAYYTDLYSFSLPQGWKAGGPACYLDLARSGDSVGSMIIRTYDPDQPVSQFHDNHRETLSSENLSGFAYPAAKAVIRATQPAAAHDDSYVDELHIYIMLADLRCAFDFCFDSAKVDEQTAVGIAKGFVPKEAAIKIYGIASQWARAIQNRDGHAQYDLLTAELQAEVKEYYEAANWVTGVSSPWVNSWAVEISGNRAVVLYMNEASSGFTGYTIDNLFFAKEKGQLKISDIDGVNDFSGYENTSMQKNVQLPESNVVLASLPKDHIFIYGDKNDYDKYGGYDGLYLSVKGVNKYYKWQNIGKDSFLPALYLKDMNGDGRKELVVILTTGEGTGVNQKAVHVINPENMTEADVINPLYIISKNVDTSIVHENGTVTITITVNGQKSVITLPEDYAQVWAEDKAVFGSIVTYEVDGAELKASVAAQISHTLFAGEVNITYTFDGTRYVMDTIDFTPYDFS